MKIWYAPYTLHAKAPLNAVSGNKERNGALLLVEFPEGDGVCDCHPWTEFGDEGLADQLKKLGQNKTTALTARSLFFAQQDARAKARNETLFKNLSIPESHYSLPDFSACHQFKVCKLKMGPSRARLDLRDLPPRMRLRLDFNASLDEKQFRNFLKDHADQLSRIDFIEDPIPFDVKLWQQISREYKILLAQDRRPWHEASSLEGLGALVIKPAISAVEHLIDDCKKMKIRLIFTSYMDHPVGQLFAAYYAALIYGKYPEFHDCAGLLTHDLFEKNEFSDEISTSGPYLKPSSGPGIGFAFSLSKMHWRKLC